MLGRPSSLFFWRGGGRQGAILGDLKGQGAILGYFEGCGDLFGYFKGIGNYFGGILEHLKGHFAIFGVF